MNGFLVRLWLPLAILGLWSGEGRSQTPAAATAPAPALPEGWRIARFQGNRPAALSLTFDDNTRDQYERGVPLLAKHALPATFFVIAGKTAETPAEAAQKKPGESGGIAWPQLKELAAAGHEIANHSWTHKQLTKLDDAGLAAEIDLAYERITERLGSAPLTFCYPGNGRNDHVREAVLQRHVAARDFQLGYGGPTWTADAANARIEQGLAKGEWMVAMIHAITEGYMPFRSADEFEQHLAWLAQRRHQVWIDTFATVARYIRERDSAGITAKGQPGNWSFVVQCPLDARYNVPLTVLIPAAGTITAPAARRAGEDAPLPVAVQGPFVAVTVAPSPAPVTVTWKTRP